MGGFGTRAPLPWDFPFPREGKFPTWPPPPLPHCGLAQSQPGLPALASPAPASLVAAQNAQSDDPFAPLASLAKGTIRQVETVGQAFNDSLKRELSPGGRIHDSASFTAVLHELSELAKRDANTKIDNTTDQAIALIGDLPEALQDPAADAYSDAIDLVEQVYGTLTSYFHIVDADAEKLVRGEVEVVDREFRHVVAAGTSAEGAVDHIFQQRRGA
ncbi:hypothetical protein BJY00DRAFT_285731 [Aspergillus carlsbadensis]|nr:hypothetical protein BJY00DRAFT_285731 [Aspergillus carlsbadensis]